MRAWRNILSGLVFQTMREQAYWDVFDRAWSEHFNAWN